MSVRDDQLDTLKVGGKDYDFYRIADLPGIDHLPYSLKVLVENLVRNIDGANITDDHVKALLDWDPAAQPSRRVNGSHCSAMSFGSYGNGCLVSLKVSAPLSAVICVRGSKVFIQPACCHREVGNHQYS